MLLEHSVYIVVRRVKRVSVYLEWDIQAALKRLEDVYDVRKVKIATAYLELSGVEWIEKIASRHNLSRDQLNVFVSCEFSQNQPSALLRRLTAIAQVSIVVGTKLHAKVVTL